MAPPAPYRVVLCETPEDEKRCLDIRIEVFIDEQGFSMEDELDAKDPGSDHLILVDTETKQDIGTIRWYPPMGKLGRLAVRKKYRRIGAGKWLVEALEDHLRSRRGKGGITNEGKDEVLIVANAQIYAEKFYNKCGYEARGVPFQEVRSREHIVEGTAENADGWDLFVISVNVVGAFDSFSKDGAPHLRMVKTLKL